MLLGRYGLGGSGNSVGPTGPTLVSSGSGSVATAGTQSVGYPATLANNDLLVISATAHVGTVTTPSGFTLEYGPISNGVSEKGYIYTRRSNGTESGSLTLTSSSVYTVARMYAFRNVATSGFIEGADSMFNNGGPTLTSLGTNRLATAFYGGYGSDPDAIAGASGGTWTLAASYRDPATTMCCSLNTISLAAIATISGGASTSYGECSGEGLMLVHA